MKQNKGTILKSSVDYIRRLKKDRDRMKQYENRSQSLEDMNKKLLLRVQVRFPWFYLFFITFFLISTHFYR